MVQRPKDSTRSKSDDRERSLVSMLTFIKPVPFCSSWLHFSLEFGCETYIFLVLALQTNRKNTKKLFLVLNGSPKKKLDWGSHEQKKIQKKYSYQKTPQRSLMWCMGLVRDTVTPASPSSRQMSRAARGRGKGSQRQPTNPSTLLPFA